MRIQYLFCDAANFHFELVRSGCTGFPAGGEDELKQLIFIGGWNQKFRGPVRKRLEFS